MKLKRKTHYTREWNRVYSYGTCDPQSRFRVDEIDVCPGQDEDWMVTEEQAIHRAGHMGGARCRGSIGICGRS
jgi:hypothetical protein